MDNCPVDYNLNNCSSKEYGLTCETCVNYNNTYIRLLQEQLKRRDRTIDIITGYNKGLADKIGELENVIKNMTEQYKQDNFCFDQLEEQNKYINILTERIRDYQNAISHMEEMQKKAGINQ